MTSYEIAIYGMSDDSEMNAVQQALHDAGITDAGDEEVGMYLHDNKPRSVFVLPSEVDKAVAVLNDLGYETDEDQGDE